jgi:3-oxoacyl-[acyl-carrier protein] reductase
MSDILDLNGKVALVTGAGQGIGRQVALHFAAHGADGVVINDFVPSRAETVVAEIEEAGGKALPAPADVTDLGAMRELITKAEEHFGRVDILVNNADNAGATPDEHIRKPFWETGPPAWDSYIGVNLYGVINSTSAVIPGMIERRAGRIITIISEAGRFGDSGLEIYAGAKAGAAGFMRAVARTLGRYSVTANCIATAMTRTPAIEELLETKPERISKMLDRYVIRRPGEPSDVANMALFLASDASSWITGQTYPVNGGFTFSL